MYRCTALSPFGYLLAALTAGLSFSAGSEEAAARKDALNRRAEAYRAVIQVVPDIVSHDSAGKWESILSSIT